MMLVWSIAECGVKHKSLSDGESHIRSASCEMKYLCIIMIMCLYNSLKLILELLYTPINAVYQEYLMADLYESMHGLL